MPGSATIQSLPAAFEMMKAMQADGLGWGENCRPLAHQALASIIEDTLAASVDVHLVRVAGRGEADRRNGIYKRHILTELGDIELSVPRTSTYCTVAVARAAARRFADRGEDDYPKAFQCLLDDLDDLLVCFRYKTEKERKLVRTTNAIKRRFRVVRRRTRPMGVFQDRTSLDGILFAVFTREDKSQNVSSLSLLTQPL